MNVYQNRTKQLLWSSLYSLMDDEKLPFDAITVNNICEKALLHRTTFYKHFEDKYTLLQYGYRSLSHKRTKFPLKQWLLYPFSLSERLRQTDSFHLAFRLSNTSPFMQYLFHRLIREAVEQDLLELNGAYTHLPEDLAINQLCSTLHTLYNYWETQATKFDTIQIDQLYQHIIASYLNFESIS